MQRCIVVFTASTLLTAITVQCLAEQSSPAIPTLTTVNFEHSYEPTCLENGFVGFRPGSNPLAMAPVTVAGFTRQRPNDGTESLCPAPWPLGVVIKLNGHEAELRPLKQSLDLSCGELTTELEAIAGDVQAAVKVIQFASRSLPSVIAQQIEIVPSQPAELEFTSQVILEGSPVEVYREGGYYQAALWDHFLGVRTDRARLGIAVVGAGADVERQQPRTYTASAGKGQAIRLDLVAALVPDFYAADPDLQAARMAQRAVMIGFTDLREQNRSLWQELWKSRVRVTGDPEAQKVLDLAFYYLHSAAHPSSQLSIPPFGLSRAENYFGHIFWDTDAWMFLPVVLTDPLAGRQLVEFRYRTLPEAKKIASLYGCQGAQYPWECSARTGAEDCPHAASTGWAEQFMGPHVAIAQWQYCIATGDKEYMQTRAWPILREVAKWICSRGVWSERGFEILTITGFDEDTPNIDNGAHMNLTCQMALHAAIACGNKLGHSVPLEWQRTADKMFIPTDDSRGVIKPYPNANHVRGQLGYSVGTLQFLLVHEPPVTDENLRATWAREEEIRRDQPVASGNPASGGANGYSSMAMASAAAFFGERDEARAIFHSSSGPYLRGPFAVMAEYRKNEFGNFVTTYGSLLQTTLLGFTGLRVLDGDWRKYPASLPAGWEAIECDRIWVKGQPMKLRAEHGSLATLSPAE